MQIESITGVSRTGKIEIEFFAIFTGLKTIILSLYKVYDNLEMDAFLRFLKKEYMRCQHPCFWKRNIVVVTPSSSCCSLSFTNYAEKFFCILRATTSIFKRHILSFVISHEIKNTYNENVQIYLFIFHSLKMIGNG